MSRFNYVIGTVIVTCVVLLVREPVIYIMSTNSSLMHPRFKKPQIMPPNNTLSNINLDPLESIRRDCGPLCNTSRPGSSGPFFNHVSAPIDCLALFKNDYIDRSHGLQHAPTDIPKNLMNDFTMNGRLKVNKWYLSDAKLARLGGNYGVSETNALRDGLRHAPGVKDGRVLVIGSERPWVEACVLEAGAKNVLTLEYGEIISEHQQIETMTPLQFRNSFLNGTLGTFDAIVTFSSIEHSGLGRYGDALNPWGDIIAIARSWCVTKEGGSLTIGVPWNDNEDSLNFNEARHYSKLRYPYLTTNWKQLYQGQGSQRVHVFSK